MGGTVKVGIKSKLGRPFWRCGVHLSPDTFTEVEVTEAQLKDLESQLGPVSEGGALEMRKSPPRGEEPKADPKKDGKTK